MGQRYRRVRRVAFGIRCVAALAAVAVATMGPFAVDDVGAAPQLRGQDGGDAPSVADCITDPAGPELYGPTDINAQTANQGLSVALNDAGTVSVLRWPSPSYYDQIRYRAWSRDEPRLGVAPTDGAFLGLRVGGDGMQPTTTWLRDWETTQEHAPGLDDEVVTTHRSDDLGLTVEVRDVVAHPADVFGRQVTVERDDSSPVDSADLLAYENLSLVTSKIPLLPVQDWCFESENTDTAAFDEELDAVVHTKEGIDESTGEPASAAIAMGFDAANTGVQVGWDPVEPIPAGVTGAAAVGALDDAADGELSGNDSLEGHTTAALATALDLDDGGADGGGTTTGTLWFAAGDDAQLAAERLEGARDAGYREVAAAKQAWLEELLADAPMPAVPESDPAHDAVLALARRALVTLVTDVDRDSRAIVASIATQSPYGEDWPRDGAFFDYTLDLIGLHDWVDDHHDFYVETQQTEADPDPTLSSLDVPAGNWGMNDYADGVVGGPIPWEIDETGYTLWNFWEHFRATGDRDRLAQDYPTVRAAADFLTTCVDEANGLQCVAHEDDNFDQRQTIVGASTVWLGLDSATKVADALGEDADAQRWSTRRAQLGAAIDTELWNGESYGEGSAPLIWPVCYTPTGDAARMATHQDVTWGNVASTFDEPAAGDEVRGQYEAKALLALAKQWRDDPERLEQVRDGLRWLAEEHAEPGTHVMGEAWQVRDGDVISVVSQPHAWEQVLFYLAALEAWSPPEVADAPVGCDGVLAALREQTGEGDGTDGPAAPEQPGEDSGSEDGSGPWPLVVGAGAAAAVLAGVGVAVARRRRSIHTRETSHEHRNVGD